MVCPESPVVGVSRVSGGSGGPESPNGLEVLGPKELWGGNDEPEGPRGLGVAPQRARGVGVDPKCPWCEGWEWHARRTRKDLRCRIGGPQGPYGVGAVGPKSPVVIERRARRAQWCGGGGPGGPCGVRVAVTKRLCVPYGTLRPWACTLLPGPSLA